MINISKYGAYIQNVLEITSDLFDFSTTVVDTNYVRVAGTHNYKKTIGKSVKNPNVFRYVMENDKCVMIENPRENVACLKCLNRDGCNKTAAIYSSLRIENKVCGGLAIIATNFEQKKRILNNTRFFQFVEQLGDLLSGKLESEQSALKLEILLKKNIAILNAVHDGVIAIDQNGIIEQINHSATSFFNINGNQYIGSNLNVLFPQSIADIVIKENKPFIDKEVDVKLNNKKSTVYLTSRPLNKSSLPGGTVISFKSAKEVTSLAHNLTLSGTRPLTFNDIIGEATTLKSVKELAKQVATGDSTILIRGESGTGKEIFARAIHNESFRSKGPFISVNCAAIPEPLLESELFGYEEGAFTGARKGGKPGKCELAAGGTLFLDEVGDIPLFLQSKFLRMLQERTIERVGGTKTIPIDVRIIAATHRNLEYMIENKEFRQDLYYRINVIPITLPPLRERKEDIYNISKHFINKYAHRLNKNIHDISTETINLLRKYYWPGNIRELENSIEYAVNVESSDVITSKSLPSRITTYKFTEESTSPAKDVHRDINETIRNLEQNALINTINKFGWSTKGKQEAAKHLGISIATLYRKLKK